MMAGWSEQDLELGDVKLHLWRGGRGRPVLVLHHDIGTPDRLPFYDALADKFDVIVPSHPGFGVPERPQWMRHPPEMAALAPRDFHRLVLVGAMGVKPPEGDIFDQAIVSYLDYAHAGFHDRAAFTRIYGEVSTDQLVAWDLCREMCFRIAWKPYMYSQTLPHLLGGVRAPALVVWGDDDRIVPKSAGELYARSLPNARLEIVRASGHCVDMEQ